MDRNTERDWRYLDTEPERQAVVEDIRRVRRSVIALARSVPSDKHSAPRYHGWSLSAMLMHLYVMDSMAMVQIKAALVGITPKIPLAWVNRFNATTARWFQRRLVETTITQIERHQSQIIPFVLGLPIDQFSHPVWHPPSGAVLTVERAVQAYFLYHWEEHLATMQKVDGIFNEPPQVGRV